MARQHTAVADAEVRRVHQAAVVVDAALSGNFARPGLTANGKSYLDRAREGGLTAAVQTLAASNTNFRNALSRINESFLLLEAEPEKTLLVRTSADIERARRERKVGIVFGFQDGTPLEDDWINLLPTFWRIGVRVIQLTYNEHNRIGSGCLEPNDFGLTAYGRQVVGAMNRFGIMVDLSHTGEKTCLDAIEYSRDPCIVSHANVKKLNPSPRNKTDEVIKALAAKGGLIGVVAWSVIAATRPGVPPTIDDFCAHIDYLVDLVGVDHVCIGSDINENFRVMPIPSPFEQQYSFMLTQFKERAPAVEGFSEVAQYPNVTRALLARGYGEQDVHKILGGNFMRLARATWDKRPPH
ncbi:MAG: membrane dipeptidase [Armatimonadetes bacterium]|nr:membrane dipeptidase [Armatimonadota bacterium]